MHSSQNSGVLLTEEAERIEFEKFLKSNSFVIWKMNFKHEVCCSSSSFPTHALLWINEIDSARNMEEFWSSNSVLGRMIPDLEVLDSRIASALQS